MRPSHRRMSTLLVVTVLTAIIAMTVGAVAGGQSAGVREGTCDLAEQLFPNHNPGPGSLKRVPVPEPTDLVTGRIPSRATALALVRFNLG